MPMQFLKQAFGPFSISPSIPSSAPLLRSLPLHNVLIKSDQEHSLPRPHSPFFPSIVRTDRRLTADATTNAFYYPCNVRGAVQLRHLLRDTDVLIDQGFVVADHVFAVIRAGGFNRVGGPRKKVPPKSVSDELEERQDASGSRGWVSRGRGTEE